ncbi:hypothetical protein NDU88_004949 [Pleurodeles waltl]|uniref:Uncharacterized protein n=1 Tax=Pleurodeles waltl TaxID=8319 RepID=A0AAV7W9N7_PLEWA|nr:hypothetical protein NDU88_004949 [Pleurodeles waltl]
MSWRPPQVRASTRKSRAVQAGVAAHDVQPSERRPQARLQPLPPWGLRGLRLDRERQRNACTVIPATMAQQQPSHCPHLLRMAAPYSRGEEDALF